MITNPNETAFPASENTTSGLTKREYMATVILSGVISSDYYNASDSVDVAISMTDELIEKLSKK